jgi:hypothetical protein
MNLLRKLNTADRVVVVSTIVLIVSPWLDWFEATFPGGLVSGSATINGWDVEERLFWVVIPFVLAVLSLAAVVIRAGFPRIELPALPIGYGQAIFFAGAASAGLVLMKVLVSESSRAMVIQTGGQTVVVDDIDVSRSYGIFVALLAAVGFAVGGYLKWQNEQSGHETGTSSPTPF